MLLLLVFFLLILVSVLFGSKIKKLELSNPTFLKTTVQPSKPKSTSAPVSDSSTSAERISVVAENLEIPWGLVFLPDKSILFTERPGRVRFIDSSGNLRKEPVATISDVYANGEGGLLGIAVDPKFSENNFVYLYYSYKGDRGDMRNKVVRYVFDGKSLTGQKIIVDSIPGNSNHDGGRIKFGPDGYLYITTGDSQDPSLAQDKSSLAGKILRVDLDGNPAPDNPFNTLIYSYGHRNPQGLAWDEKGRLWATEHGRSGIQSGFDELNLIEPGKNYGWQIIQGDQKKDGMVTPVLHSGAMTTWAPAGMAHFNNSLFFGGLRGQGLYEAVINGSNVTLKKHFDGELGRIRDVILGPDNMLYVTTSNRDGRGLPKENDDKIFRVNPQKL